MILAPSILSLDYSRFNESMEVLNRKCRWLHFDVMDGNPIFPLDQIYLSVSEKIHLYFLMCI